MLQLEVPLKIKKQVYLSTVHLTHLLKHWFVLQGKPEDGILPVDLIIEQYIEETALEPGTRKFFSVIDMMKEKGLAIPLPK